MDRKTEEAFVAHVKEVERRAIDGDQHAAKSLACMALLADGWKPDDPGGGEIIDLKPYLRLVA